MLVLSLAIATPALSQTFHTLTFTQQKFHSDQWKTTERFGKSEFEIQKMGHDRFVAWYCDDARATKTGRLEAEKTYCLAMNECCAPFLERMSREKQYFVETAISALADFSKSAWAIGIESGPDGVNWDLPAAEINTAVAETTYALLDPRVPFSHRNVELPPMLARVAERVKAKDPKAKGTRLDSLSDYLNKLFEARPEREKMIIQTFSARMITVALLNPLPG